MTTSACVMHDNRLLPKSIFWVNPVFSPFDCSCTTMTPEEMDRCEHTIEAQWGKQSSAIWQASFAQVQETWQTMLSQDIQFNRWGESEEECCWEAQLASTNERPTKELRRRKTRRTKVEIASMMPLKSCRRVRAYCTHISLRAMQKFPLPKLHETDASHLCQNPRCVRPSHLAVESRQANHKRKNCMVKMRCPCCHVIMPVCSHVPPCIHSSDWNWSNW
jgi:hypothetical protein